MTTKTKQRIPILVCVCVCVCVCLCERERERERERVYAYQCLQIFIWKHGLGCFSRGDSCLVSFQIHWPIFQIILDSRHYERQQSTTAAATKSKSKSKCSLQTYKTSSEDMDQHCWNQPSRCEGMGGATLKGGGAMAPPKFWNFFKYIYNYFNVFKI